MVDGCDGLSCSSRETDVAMILSHRFCLLGTGYPRKAIVRLFISENGLAGPPTTVFAHRKCKTLSTAFSSTAIRYS